MVLDPSKDLWVAHLWAPCGGGGWSPFRPLHKNVVHDTNLHKSMKGKVWLWMKSGLHFK